MNHKGYIAITISLILSFLLLAITTSVGFSTWFSRFGSLDAVSKQTSFYLAQACLEKAKLKLAQNNNYTGNETINVGSYTCRIYGITTQGSQKTIQTRAAINNAATNFQLVVNMPQLTTTSLQELNHF